MSYTTKLRGCVAPVAPAFVTQFSFVKENLKGISYLIVGESGGGLSRTLDSVQSVLRL